MSNQVATRVYIPNGYSVFGGFLVETQKPLTVLIANCCPPGVPQKAVSGRWYVPGRDSQWVLATTDGLVNG